MAHTRASLLKIISAYDRETRKWVTRAERIIKRYRDERSESESTTRRFNVLWSNVETLKPFLYSATPKPIVEQRGDMADPVARVAAQVLEKALSFTVAENHFGSSLRNARDDYLLAGRGTVWARYVPEFKPAEAQVSENNTDDQPGTAGIGDTVEVLAFETTVIDYVHWKDFGHDLARTWEEVDVVWRRVAMDREALTKRFGEKGEKLPLDVKAEQKEGQNADDPGDKALVYEAWIKSEKRAVWLSKSGEELLDDKADPLKLDHFFPCPRPVYATTTTDTLIPIPDYSQYQDQAAELDDLTGRIALLTKAIRAAGVYDAGVPALKALLDDGHDNTLIPVDSWAALAEKGGIKGAIELLPMNEIAQTLLGLYQARDHVKADLYEVSGMSDIIRGNTDPRETATAQRGKMSFATKRLEERQREVERFARNSVDLIGNIIAVHFNPETLITMTGIKLLPTVAMKQSLQQAAQAAQAQPQQGAPAPTIAPEMLEVLAKPEVQQALALPTWEEVTALLKSEPKRRFTIDIETDSLVAADDAQEQESRVQFIQASAGFLQTAGQIVQAQPLAAPLMGELLMFGARSFRAGRDLTQAFEEFVKKAEAAAAQPKPPQPDPAMAKVQADAQIKQQEMQLDAQAEERRMQSEAQLAMLKAHLADQAEQQRQEREQQAAQTQAMMDAAFARFKALLDARTKIEVAEITAGAALEPQQITAANDGTGPEAA